MYPEAGQVTTAVKEEKSAGGCVEETAREKIVAGSDDSQRAVLLWLWESIRWHVHGIRFDLDRTKWTTGGHQCAYRYVLAPPCESILEPHMDFGQIGTKPFTSAL